MGLEISFGEETEREEYEKNYIFSIVKRYEDPRYGPICIIINKDSEKFIIKRKLEEVDVKNKLKTYK